jgi:hypothetical protein
MGEWIEFDRWRECVALERPGIIFEVTNSEGLSLFTPCVQSLQTPSGWKSGPVRFRAISATPPRRSSPIPEPQRP